MLKYKVGDLIEAAKSGEVNVIAHCCNCFNVMGSGIAPQIKKAFPGAYEADQETVKGECKKLGTYSLWSDIYAPYTRVYNLYGQFGYGKRNEGKRDLNYNALYDSLSLMAVDLLANSVLRGKVGFMEDLKVGMPLLGSGLANGDWDIISLMIDKTLGAVTDVTIYVLDEALIPHNAERIY